LREPDLSQVEVALFFVDSAVAIEAMGAKDRANVLLECQEIGSKDGLTGETEQECKQGRGQSHGQHNPQGGACRGWQTVWNSGGT